MSCPNLEMCPFINDLNNEDNKKIYLNKFCNLHYERCARFILSNTNNEVPIDLAPDEIDRLKEFMKN